MISIDNLSVSFGGWSLFDQISFLINPKDRIGLVGRNGAGKTTILKLIAGLQQPTSGAVTKNADCTIGYLPQQMQVADTTTLLEETAKAFEEVLAIGEVEEIKRLLIYHGALNACMSGSGSAVFGIFKEKGKSPYCS